MPRESGESVVESSVRNFLIVCQNTFLTENYFPFSAFFFQKLGNEYLYSWIEIQTTNKTALVNGDNLTNAESFKIPTVLSNRYVEKLRYFPKPSSFGSNL